MPDATYNTQVPTDKVFYKVTYHVCKGIEESIEQKLGEVALWPNLSLSQIIKPQNTKRTPKNRKYIAPRLTMLLDTALWQVKMDNDDHHYNQDDSFDHDLLLQLSAYDEHTKSFVSQAPYQVEEQIPHQRSIMMCLLIGGDPNEVVPVLIPSHAVYSEHQLRIDSWPKANNGAKHQQLKRKEIHLYVFN